MTKNFVHYDLQNPKDDDFIFVFSDQEICLTSNKTFLTYREFRSIFSMNIGEETESFYCFFDYQGRRCLLLECSRGFLSPSSSLQMVNIRTLYPLLLPAEFELLMLGKHLYHWRQQSKFCGQCGGKMIDLLDERARQCANCQHIQYPNLTPCVIMLVTRGEEMLLARSPHFTPGVYSTLAGFVEPGETLEFAVSREVQEEVGISIGMPQYVCSQPWPFPSSLMLGFLAEYESGDIVIDPCEIEDAAWFSHKIYHYYPRRPALLGSSLIYL